jgi:hypothetical protein
MKNLKLNLLLFLIFLLFSCKTENKNNNVIPPPEQKLYDIKGFYFFKQNMSYEDVINLLRQKKIKFKVINLNNPNEINYPLTWNYVIIKHDFNRLENIKIIEGYNLPILNKQISRFQICFFDNKIFYFNYQQNFDENQTGLEIDQKIRGDIDLLSILSEGLRFKYGNPNINNGNLNVYNLPNQVDEVFSNDNYSKKSRIKEDQIWIGKDSIIHIRLENWLITESLNSEPYNVKSQSGTTIEVLFNSKFADEIVMFNKMFDKREDSLKKVKREQIKQFKKKIKLEEFEKL